MLRRVMATILAGLTALALLSPLRAATQRPRAHILPSAQRAAVVRDLFQAGRELCQDGQYALGGWAIQRASLLSRDDPGIRLWLGHALCQTGDERRGQHQLREALRLLEKFSTPGGETAAEQGMLYHACACNYLGAVAALQGDKQRAATWFEKAAEEETEIREVARANQKTLDAGAPFTWYVPSARRTRGRASTRPGVAAAPTAEGSASVARRWLQAQPIRVQLVDARAALAKARECVRNRDPNQALSLTQRAGKLDRSVVGKDYYHCLAEAYEAKRWLPEAVMALESASAARDAGQEPQARLQQLVAKHPEVQLEPRGLLVGKRLRLRFSCSPALAGQAMSQLERIREHVQSTFGVKLPAVYVRIFDDQASMVRYHTLRTGKAQASWAAAWAIGTSHSPGILTHAENAPSELLKDMKHEYGHLVWRALGGQGRLPKWLDEGLADVVEEGPATATRRLRNAYAADRLMSPSNLERFWKDRSVKTQAEDETVYLCYDQARALVSFLLETRGGDMVMDWLLLLRAGHDAHEAFQLLTGQTWEQFFQIWANTCLR